MIRHLLDSLRSWWTYRQIPALHIDIAASGDTSWLLIHTGRRGPKRAVVEVKVDRDELLTLGAMIWDSEAGPDSKAPNPFESLRTDRDAGGGQ